MRLGAARMDAEPGDDLVKDEEPPVARRQLAQRFEELATHRHRAEMPARRFQDDAADLPIVRQRALLQLLKRVERQRPIRRKHGQRGHADQHGGEKGSHSGVSIQHFALKSNR